MGRVLIAYGEIEAMVDRESGMHNRVELKNVVIFEFCMLNTKTGKTEFYKTKKKIKGFTGIYFKDDYTFFALYPAKNDPTIFFNGKEYSINRNLQITLAKQGKNRRFIIEDYGIEIDYIESKYLDWDVWSDEISIDLFFMIEQRYKTEEFYEQYTLANENAP